MKDNLKGLLAVWTFTMGFMAAMMVPGLLMQPTIVKAWQTINPQEICSKVGGTGQLCYDCTVLPSPTGTGCNGTTAAPTGYFVGVCVFQSSSPTECTSDTVVCGSQKNCATGLLNGFKCASFSVCSGS